MNKTIISLLIGAAVLTGGYGIYSVSQQVKDTSLLSIEGTNLAGVFQQITFSQSACTFVEGQKQVQGTASIEDVETMCGISDEVGVTNDQFNCAVDLCQGDGLPGELRLCSNPSVSFTSQGGGSCTISGGCSISIDGVDTDVTGSYEMSASEYTSLQNSCGGSGSSYDTCMAYGCAGQGIADNGIFTNEDPEKEENTQQGGGIGTVPTPIRNNTSR